MAEKPELTEHQVLMMRVSRLERVLQFILEHNRELNAPDANQMGQINLKAIEDAKNGSPATH